jgi:hypothetical protein
LENGLRPEDYPLHFEEIRSKISGKPAEKAMSKKATKEAPVKKEKKSGAAEKRGQGKEE